jgi:hypothetical protein
MKPGPIVLLALVAGPALPTAAGAQSNGAYTGTIACERMAGRAASNNPFALTVEAAQAAYSREVQAVDGSPMGLAEAAKAAIGADGALILASTIEAGSFHYEARYEGRLGEASGKLAGTQAWLLGNDRVARKCTITLNRRAAAAPRRERPPRPARPPARPDPDRPAQTPSE